MSKFRVGDRLILDPKINRPEANRYIQKLIKGKVYVVEGHPTDLIGDYVFLRYVKSPRLGGAYNAGNFVLSPKMSNEERMEERRRQLNDV